MVETRRSSAPSKRPPSSPPPPSKRSKASHENSSSTDDESNSAPKATESREPEVGSADLPCPGSPKPSEPPTSVEKGVRGQPEDLGANVDGEPQLTVPSAKRPKKRLPKSPNLLIFGAVFTVGNGSQCNLSLDDTSVGKTLCKLRRAEHGGSLTAKLETTGGSGAVQVNGEILQKSPSKILTGEDEVIFGLTGKHAYIFQELTNDTLADLVPIHPWQ